MKFEFSSQIKQKTDKELNEIFNHVKDYDPDFVRLAEEELKSRNIDVDALKKLSVDVNQKENLKLSHGKAGSPLYIFLGFVLSLLGGLLGIYAGYLYSRSKTEGDDGEEYYSYDENTRQLGTVMMWLGIAVLVFFTLRRIVTT